MLLQCSYSPQIILIGNQCYLEMHSDDVISNVVLLADHIHIWIWLSLVVSSKTLTHVQSLNSLRASTAARHALTAWSTVLSLNST